MFSPQQTKWQWHNITSVYFVFALAATFDRFSYLSNSALNLKYKAKEPARYSKAVPTL
jgi:hypothetical protein